MDWNELKKNNSLEDFYIEDERAIKCEKIIDEIIEYLKKETYVNGKEKKN